MKRRSFACAPLVCLLGIMVWAPSAAGADSEQDAPAELQAQMVQVKISVPTSLFTVDAAGNIVSAGSASGPWLAIPALRMGDAKSQPASSNAAPDASAEENLLQMINADRVKCGLRPLVMDEALRAVARKHSADMAARSYFGHESPDGMKLRERLRNCGTSCRFAAENLALGGNPELAHKCLMESPRHKSNILHSKARRVGIGIVCGAGAMWFTQVFAD